MQGPLGVRMPLRQAQMGQEVFNSTCLLHPSPFMSPSQKAWGRNHGLDFRDLWTYGSLPPANRLALSSFSLIQKLGWPHMNLARSPPPAESKMTLAHSSTPHPLCRLKASCTEPHKHHARAAASPLLNTWFSRHYSRSNYWLTSLPPLNTHMLPSSCRPGNWESEILNC